MDWLKFIRTVPDFPEPGIMFRDVTTLFAEPQVFKAMIEQFNQQFNGVDIDYIGGIDARGFIIGAALALTREIGFVPVRKKGKLPYNTISEDYALEYGTATLELHTDAVSAGSKVLIVDDLIATGGTAVAAVNLFRKLNANVIGCAFLVDLPELGGADKLRSIDVSVTSLCAFDGH
ncbi:adenine phosphoribosyltransferase [Alphaproteobacteria bacterium]|nr:adenine phosphoribosyltransferase [Alphaproteobacteria bacterium]